MIYDIEWVDSAQRDLAQIWQSADSNLRSIIEVAMPRVIDRLTIAPYSQGEARLPGITRVLFELPLKVIYRIERFSGAVIILAVTLVSKRQQ